MERDGNRGTRREREAAGRTDGRTDRRTNKDWERERAECEEGGGMEVGERVWIARMGRRTGREEEKEESLGEPTLPTRGFLPCNLPCLGLPCPALVLS